MAGKYTVNEVEERTKVPASTLRQWERRYGFPKPERSESGYRLYSDRDLQQIEGMKRHIEDGVPASRAADLVKRMSLSSDGPRSVQAMSKELVEALVELDESKADNILSEAHSLHSVEVVMFKLIQGAMCEIGERWHAGMLNTTTEHFASSYVHGRLRSLLSFASNNRRAPAIIVACAPSEQHELGALMLAVMLKRNGYRVYYVGADTPVNDLYEMTNTLHPVAVMISASVETSIERLKKHQKQLLQITPLLVFGGAAFDRNPSMAKALGGTYFQSDISKAMEDLQGFLKDVKVSK